MTLAPILAVDELVHDTATRAFADLSRRWFSHSSTREDLLATVEQLGFKDALPSPDGRDAWPTAAALIRAQARFATPIDMALLLATGDRAGSISQLPARMPAQQASTRPIARCARRAIARTLPADRCSHGGCS